MGTVGTVRDELIKRGAMGVGTVGTPSKTTTKFRLLKLHSLFSWGLRGSGGLAQGLKQNVGAQQRYTVCNNYLHSTTIYHHIPFHCKLYHTTDSFTSLPYHCSLCHCDHRSNGTFIGSCLVNGKRIVKK